MIFVFLVVWVTILLGLTSVHKLKGRLCNVLKEIAVAFVVTAITCGILAAIVYLF